MSPDANPSPDARSGYGSSTVDKAVDVLAAVAGSAAGMTNAEISEALELDRSTAHRLLTTLERRGLLERAAGRRFVVGHYVGFLAIGARQDPRLTVEPVLDDLATLTGESASFSILHRDHFYCVAHRVSSHELSYCPTSGHGYPLNSGAAGLALWAFLPTAQRDRLLAEADLPSFTESTLTDRTALLRELETTAERGYGQSAGVRTPGGCSIACPVIGRQGVVMGALALSAAEVRVPLAELTEYVPDLTNSAQHLAGTMGGGHD